MLGFRGLSIMFTGKGGWSYALNFRFPGVWEIGITLSKSILLELIKFLEFLQQKGCISKSKRFWNNIPSVKRLNCVFVHLYPSGLTELRWLWHRINSLATKRRTRSFARITRKRAELACIFPQHYYLSHSDHLQAQCSVSWHNLVT